ncbi:hypothetical protein KBJ98_15000 [Flavobacterium sp. F-328]|uniref:Phage tail protein n=1 Tax=Flavobacterium erciyesense TaxID=2825842 RepID=A0ABS5D7P4_9FLAO|nr:hypothetical protein [Flavobacterium erciyesense]MBQ0910018.1 hypothetical protein [Flavobacterium erciyesense]
MKFALITEGVSEHRIIKHIISKYFKDKEPDINQVQPKLVNNKQNVTGGWDEVLKYCQRQELADIFIENDYLIIQIDTDQSQLNPFNITHTKIDPISGNLTNKTIEELYNDVKAKIESLINVDILKKYNDKIFYAICTHTIECWLLPIYYTNNHKNDIATCIGSLNAQLKKKNIQSLPTTTKNKNSAQSIKIYNTILNNWKKRKEIEDAAIHQYGLNKFLESLRTLD